MRSIVFLCSDILNPLTGGDKYDTKMYEMLREEGFDVSWINIVSMKTDVLRRHLWIRTLWRFSFVQKLIIALFIPTVLSKHLKNKSYLFIVNEGSSQALLLFNLYQRFIRKSCIIIIVHHLEFYTHDSAFSITKLLERIAAGNALSLAHAIVTVSEFSKSDIISTGVQKGKIVIIPNGLDRQQLCIANRGNRSSQNDRITFLCVAHCVPSKGIEFLIEAAHIINQNCQYDFSVEIVGTTYPNSNYHMQILEKIEKNHLTQIVKFHGRAAQVHMNALYERADIFILPSLKEGFGIVLLEAMHYGLPIISTKVSAIPELIQEGENGILVPPADASKLADAMTQLMINPILRSNIGANNKLKVDAGYSWDESYKKFLYLIQNVKN